jgi:hypothetical protein
MAKIRVMAPIMAELSRRERQLWAYLPSTTPSYLWTRDLETFTRSAYAALFPPSIKEPDYFYDEETEGLKMLLRSRPPGVQKKQFAYTMDVIAVTSYVYVYMIYPEAFGSVLDLVSTTESHA